MTRTIEGSHVALPTPFRDGAVDLPALRGLVERQVEGGSAGIVVAGTTGEASTLTEGEFGRAYFQDDLPVRRATALRGHAVRALYLAAGAVDVAVETGDDALLAAVVRQWEAAVARRTYVTGGMGSHHRDESFGDDFVLPPDRAYSETCAGVASVMLGWRLLLATGEPRFADLVERTLFNVVATSPAEDGRSFFYANTLHRRHRGVAPAPDTDSPRADSGLRAPWFAVSCCPTNVARTLAQLRASLDADARAGPQPVGST